MDSYPPGFEERDDLRSAFIHELIIQQASDSAGLVESHGIGEPEIPKTLLRYWHDPSNLPADVQVCIESWNRLDAEGFTFRMYDDATAKTYIAEYYSEREQRAFARCEHPAMRSDYFRLCFILAEGGLYVDTDDVLLGEEWQLLFKDSRLKVQPMCYDKAVWSMMPAADIWRSEMRGNDCVFYVNNDPLAAPPRHPVIHGALIRATEKLLSADRSPEIQATTGPGNLTVALAAHARRLQLEGLPNDFEILRDWEAIAEMRWDLSYREDDRNWRIVYGC